jgi:hypothetical protein
MQGDEPSGFETWNVDLPRLPGRSRLYSLRPIGVGTWEAESLSSYVARLSQAHAVELHDLMRSEVYPRMEPRRSLRRWALNGSGPMAQKAVQALEDLTGRGDLRYLTFMPWAQVINATPMLRREKAWCPHCYAEWQRRGETVYEPLLWTITRVERCLRHGTALASECPFPACRAQSSPLSSRSRPGFCGMCGEWLGTDATTSGGPVQVAGGAARIVALVIEHAVDAPGQVVRHGRRPVRDWQGWEALASQLEGHETRAVGGPVDDVIPMNSEAVSGYAEPPVRLLRSVGSR